MLYEKYLKKVNRLANILKLIRQYRVLITVVISVAMASATSFMAVQGVVYDGIDSLGDVIYGEGLNYEAKAVFGDVSYEYADASRPDEWFSEEPLVPGKYLVRGVSESTFGTPRYGKAQEYSIVPKNITVNVVESEILYGDTPTVSADLVYGDSIFCDKYTYEDISQKTTNIQAIIDSVVINDENGNDITHYYSITAAVGSINLLPHEISRYACFVR